MSLARRLGGIILVLLLLAAPAAAQELTLDLDGGTLERFLTGVNRRGIHKRRKV